MKNKKDVYIPPDEIKEYSVFYICPKTNKDTPLVVRFKDMSLYSSPSSNEINNMFVEFECSSCEKYHKIRIR